jgi:hypothetical protein
MNFFDGLRGTQKKKEKKKQDIKALSIYAISFLAAASDAPRTVFGNAFILLCFEVYLICKMINSMLFSCF